MINDHLPKNDYFAIVLYWASCCLTPISEQFFRYTMARTSYSLVRWYIDICFVLDQREDLDVWRASSLKQQSIYRHVAPLEPIALIMCQPVFVLPNVACLEEVQQMPFVLRLIQSEQGSSAISTALEGSTLYSTEDFAISLCINMHRRTLQLIHYFKQLFSNHTLFNRPLYNDILFKTASVVYT